LESRIYNAAVPVSASLSNWQLLGVICASAVFWMQYVQLKDSRKPEPRRRMFMAFGLGIVAWLLAMLASIGLEALGLTDIKFGERPWTAAYCFLLVGPIEEGCKALLAYAFVFRWREFDEPIDGFVYAAALALGFASAESFYNVPGLAWPEQLARTAALPITHVLFSAIWGFGAGYAHCCVKDGTRRKFWQFGTLALGMFAHGLYDFLILAYQATFLTSGLALGIWIFVIWRAKVSVQHHDLLPTSLPTSDSRSNNSLTALKNPTKQS
jgi:RsiW-degrading membrane proteinase PrsW (M82 family)